ncbi:MAG: ankyrin repeat domain-containing protein [Deltaproteobacteria bacterium]|nr:ankyrin repeat domain-containing protein [Deltaproteobacteria bacterium]
MRVERGHSGTVWLPLFLLVICFAANAHADKSMNKAARKGDAAEVASLLAAGADPNEGDKNGVTALHLAALEGHLEVMTLLVEAGADVDQAEYDGDTPLINASEFGHADVVQYLVDRGADSSMESSQGYPAIKHARRAGHNDVVVILKTAARRSPAQQPAGGGQAQARVFEIKPPKVYKPGYTGRIAAVIGINAYQKWPPLTGAAPDARRVAAQLKKLGFDTVLELYDEAATRDGILRLLGSTLQAKTAENDLVVIFFAGHGQTETLPGPAQEKRGYIIPVDGDPRRTFSTGIPMHQLRELTNRLPAKHIYYAMDSCYSGLGFTRGLGMVKKSSSNYIDKVTSLRSVQMVTAGGEGEEVLERDGRGLFTSSFIAALSGEADLNDDGYVTANEIGTYVTPRVTEESNAQQTPQSGRLEGEGEIAFKLPDH